MRSEMFLPPAHSPVSDAFELTLRLSASPPEGEYRADEPEEGREGEEEEIDLPKVF